MNEDIPTPKAIIPAFVAPLQVDSPKIREMLYKGPTDSVKYTTPCCMGMCFDDPYTESGPWWYVARVMTAPCFCCSNECVEGTINWTCNSFCWCFMCCGWGFGGPCSCSDCYFHVFR